MSDTIFVFRCRVGALWVKRTKNEYRIVNVSMKGHKPKIIIILGQTATGKSDFAVEVAHAVGGEIISADSRQVYKGMDLGTGKITKKEMQGIPHYLLDVVSPKKIFSVTDFQKLATQAIADIVNKKKIPIICGGTGFYINAVVEGVILPEVPPNKALRAKLAKKTPAQLFAILTKLDPQRATTIDPHNPVRLIRAIEIAKALGKVPFPRQDLGRYTVLKIGLTLPDEVLKDKIKTRLIARIKKGMLREIQRLHGGGVSWKRMEMLGLEYRYGALFLQSKMTKQEMIEKLSTEIWHYAKRQKTWFKRDIKTIWIDSRKINEKAKVIKKVKEFLK